MIPNQPLDLPLKRIIALEKARLEELEIKTQEHETAIRVDKERSAALSNQKS